MKIGGGPIAILAFLFIFDKANVNAFSISSSRATTRVQQAPKHVNLLQTQGDDHDLQISSTSLSSSSSKTEFFKSMGRLVLERSDTLQSAGFYNENQMDIGDNKKNKEFYPPLVAGAKTNITLFLIALGYKWYRSIFINKLAIWERQPQWNTVITSKEDEEKANLEAMTCNQCGSTIFIAKGRKWFQMPNGYKCYCCGATGEEAFTNTREELLEEIDDDYFDYEKPLDFVTAAERRQLMKQAGGDEEKANALLTQGNKSNDETEASGGDSDGSVKTKKKKKKKGKKKKKKAVEDAPTPTAESNDTTPTNTKSNDDDDDFALLGLD